MKYSQHFTFAEVGIDIVPYAAGHMIGGTIWKISKETDEIIYAVDFNHRRERVLNPAMLESLVRPSVLITDSFSVQTPAHSARESERKLLDTIKRHLGLNGNVLIPVDSAGRVLELLLVLDEFCGQEPLLQNSVVYFSPMAYHVVEVPGLLRMPHTSFTNELYSCMVSRVLSLSLSLSLSL